MDKKSEGGKNLTLFASFAGAEYGSVREIAEQLRIPLEFVQAARGMESVYYDEDRHAHFLNLPAIAEAMQSTNAKKKTQST